MLLSGYVKLKYKQVGFRHWPPKLSHVAFNLHIPTYVFIL
jgi:hypothetical protein